MDDPTLDPAEHRRALGGLSRIHRVSGTTPAVWPAVARRGEAARARGETIRVLDVACGGGDLAVDLQRRADARGLPIRVDGCDRSRVALERSRRRAARHETACAFFALDAVADELPGGYDTVVSSLFLHHLTADDTRGVLRKMRNAAGLVVISDLVRSARAWAVTWAGTRVLSRSPVVHVDGPRSVEGAFTIPEMRGLVAEAGLDGATIERVWPMRMRVTWRADPPGDPNTRRGAA